MIPGLRNAVLTLLLVALAACASTQIVEVPPAIDLRTLGRVGLLSFSSDAPDALRRAATEGFMQGLQRAQPGVGILELGESERVLRAVGHEQLDIAALAAIAAKYRVDVLLAGRLELTEVEPHVQVHDTLDSIGLSADVRATLTVRLLECASGSTLWSRSARRKENVASVHLLSGRPERFRSDDPNNAYAKLVRGLVRHVTADFLTRYERR